MKRLDGRIPFPTECYSVTYLRSRTPYVQNPHKFGSDPRRFGDQFIPLGEVPQDVQGKFSSRGI